MLSATDNQTVHLIPKEPTSVPHSAVPLPHSLKAWTLQTGILNGREGDDTEQQIEDPETQR